MSRRKQLEGLILDTPLQRWLARRRDQAAVEAWLVAGAPEPPPPAYKRRLLRDEAKRLGLRVLVETGTFQGETVAASLGAFHTIYSIELLDELYQRGRERFARFPHVHLRHGDSPAELSAILPMITEPALFWLDAHYSGPGTARGAVDTPIVAEFAVIASHPVPGHAILVDDSRCFTGEDGYPTIQACEALARQHWPNHRFSVAHDVMRIVPEPR